jgi:1-aminocyclopropane-1-carboxylate deaminase/D-cysteine desulfhydrase-like pyridoxal-dependent ACC family enzyme
VRSASPIIVHDVYAGAYARPHRDAEALTARLRPPLGPGLDATYSAKACYAAVRRARSSTTPVLFWHTFDARWLRPET